MATRNGPRDNDDITYLVRSDFITDGNHFRNAFVANSERSFERLLPADRSDNGIDEPNMHTDLKSTRDRPMDWQRVAITPSGNKWPHDYVLWVL